MSALEIYNLFIDMDFMDYVEQLESDLQFIQSLLDTLGERDTISFLRAYWEG